MSDTDIPIPVEDEPANPMPPSELLLMLATLQKHEQLLLDIKAALTSIDSKTESPP